MSFALLKGKISPASFHDRAALKQGSKVMTFFFLDSGSNCADTTALNLHGLSRSC